MRKDEMIIEGTGKEERKKEAEGLLNHLKKIPMQGMDTSLLLVIGFIDGLDAAQLAQRQSI